MELGHLPSKLDLNLTDYHITVNHSVRLIYYFEYDADIDDDSMPEHLFPTFYYDLNYSVIIVPPSTDFTWTVTIGVIAGSVFVVIGVIYTRKTKKEAQREAEKGLLTFGDENEAVKKAIDYFKFKKLI